MDNSVPYEKKLVDLVGGTGNRETQLIYVEGFQFDGVDTFDIANCAKNQVMMSSMRLGRVYPLLVC